MKTVTFTVSFLLFFITHFTFAQQTNNSPAPARIIGIAKDLKTGEAIGYATAALYKTGSELSVAGAVADGNGVFYITGFDLGTYELQVSFLGFETVKRTVNVNSLEVDINLGEIAMTDEGLALEEVTVQGQRELIEERVDRTIYKAENDRTTAGGDATDVLRRVPMLSVDLNGNVSMRGSSNILVLIDNRPSAIAASSIADALRQIPADEIKAVEVITSPSARFDAEGTSGVINIVTKKNNLQGMTLNINSAAGWRGSNLGLQGSARKGKMGFSLGGFGRSGYNILGSFENKQVTFEKKGKELSFLTLYSKNNRENSFTNTLFEENDLESIFSRLKNVNPSKNEEFTLQVDYVTPMDEKGSQIIEYGAKNILRKAYSDFSYFLAQGPTGAFVALPDPTLSNEFSYDQNVTAGYLSYTFQLLKNYTLKPGLRYEYTTIQADFKTDFKAEIPSYGTLVPSVNASRKLKNGNLIKLAYNRRIQRPSLRFLNPNIEASNPQQLSQGNPELDPELTDNYEIGYSTFIKGTTLNFTGFYRNTTGSIQPIRNVREDGIIFTSFENIGQEQAVGTNLFFNVNLNNKLSLNGGMDLYYSMLDNGLTDPKFAAQNEGFVVSGRAFGNYTLPKDWQIQLFTFARGRQVQLQGTSGGFAAYGLNFNKQFKEKRGSFGFGAENFLMKEMVIRNEIVTPTIIQNSASRLQNLNFKINFNYRIGKMSLDQRPRKRKSVNNDDLKDGGEGQGEQGGTPIRNR